MMEAWNTSSSKLPVQAKCGERIVRKMIFCCSHENSLSPEKETDQNPRVTIERWAEEIGSKRMKMILGVDYVDIQMPSFMFEAHIHPLSGSVVCRGLTIQSLFRNWLSSKGAASLKTTLISWEQPTTCNDCLMRAYKILGPLCFNPRYLRRCNHAACGPEAFAISDSQFKFSLHPVLLPSLPLPQNSFQQITCIQIAPSMSSSRLIIPSQVVSFLHSCFLKFFLHSKAKVIFKCKLGNVTPLHGFSSPLKKSKVLSKVHRALQPPLQLQHLLFFPILTHFPTSLLTCLHQQLSQVRVLALAILSAWSALPLMQTGFAISPHVDPWPNVTY